jgi:hypothetical protein
MSESRRLENLYNKEIKRHAKKTGGTACSCKCDGACYYNDDVLEAFSIATDEMCFGRDGDRGKGEDEFFFRGLEFAGRMKENEKMYYFYPEDAGCCLIYKGKSLDHVVKRIKKKLEDLDV